MSTGLLDAVTAATEHQPRVRAALTAALKGGASHAYLFYGPAGTGKQEVARAFAAELLAVGVEEADAPGVSAAETRRRALLDPSPHPDLIWVAPDGMQHRVEEIRDRIIRMASRRPFEGGRRVFVIEQAEAMRDEAQNALLKTLEEPPGYVHLILISQAVEEVLPTVRSRCQMLEFAPLPAAVVERQLMADPELSGQAPDALRAASRLAAGDLGRARHLISDQGQGLRAAVERFTDVDDAAEPWQDILAAAEKAGEEAEARAQERIDANAELGLKLSKTESGQAVRREARRARTEVLDLALELVQLWLRDLGAIIAGVPELAHNCDRLPALEGQAGKVRESGPRVGIVLVSDYRQRLRLNVSEELALEALHSELRRALRL